MKTSTENSRIAMVAEQDSPAASLLTARLTSDERSRADWFTLDHLADLDRRVCRGQVHHVVFRQPADLLDGLWDGEVQLGRWLEGGVRIDFAEPSSSALTQEAVVEVHRCWERWNRRHRRRQAIAGAILSTVVIGCCFLLNLLWPIHLS